ncbi:rhomboid family intramembrane serine protease [Parafrankia sp. BMG5.11]|uniref:rhomboid family intramembrane serine protease n=1 Tax=Parafrankia sp. BMG5.11 TaxID=222540 RepID=UPI00103A9F7D|nr:rhomboid family intramembrane serine protease [Parafrankia sp. BMG5.11]TCJ35316.1 rhomboid family intramembrane serine protease [Parafrankia sp. BMG5.11]
MTDSPAGDPTRAPEGSSDAPGGSGGAGSAGEAEIPRPASPLPAAGEPPPAGGPPNGGPPNGGPASGGPPHEQVGWRPETGPPAGHAGWTPPPAGAPSLPHCYRHPERETYVTCQRCGRPICPDCMRPAAVGFHCPEESGAGGGGRPERRREPRTDFGGRPGAGRRGLVTQVLISLCLVAFVLQGLPGLARDSGSLNQFSADFRLYGVSLAWDDQYYRLLTAAFLHVNYLHVLVNLYALFVLGYQLEAILGRLRLVALFVACAVGGNTLSYLVNGVSVNSVGASTAIFGFFGAYYVIARRLRADTTQILILIGINFALTFTLSFIDRWGHVGGLAAGVLVGLLYAYVPPRRTVVQAAGVLALVGLLFAAAVIKSADLTTAFA